MNRKKGYLLIFGCDWSFDSVSLSVLSRIVAEENCASSTVSSLAYDTGPTWFHHDDVWRFEWKIKGVDTVFQKKVEHLYEERNVFKK